VLNTNLTNKEIAEMLGFADEFHFSPRHENSWVKIGSGKRPRL
jgi:hypothetical protein